MVPAKLGEVQEAVKRVFKDAAVIDQSYKPSFLAGDFNGDASQDIAVILKPAPGKLDEMNQELPPWLLRDPRSNKPPKVRLKIDQDEVLLAVIHGYGANDWRDPQATQTFVLKNVVGNDLRVHTGNEFVSANSGRKLPRPQGDLIGETLQGSQGYLYYASANYAWYDPKTFQGDTTPKGMVHARPTMRAHATKACDHRDDHCRRAEGQTRRECAGHNHRRAQLGGLRCEHDHDQRRAPLQA